MQEVTIVEALRYEALSNYDDGEGENVERSHGRSNRPKRYTCQFVLEL